MDNTETQKRVQTLYEVLDAKRDSSCSSISLVYPRLYIGDHSHGMSIFSIKRYGVSVIILGDCLNCITGSQDRCSADIRRLLLPYQFKNKPAYIHMDGLKIMGIMAIDHDDFQISNFFNSAADFIEEALMSSTRSSVLVLSKHGKSRSAAIVIAYLMQKQGMDLNDALMVVAEHRAIRPNSGFMVQLLRFGDALTETGRTVMKPKFKEPNPFPLRSDPKSDIIIRSNNGNGSDVCCAMHSYENIPPSFVFKIVDDRERDERLFTVSAFDRQKF